MNVRADGTREKLLESARELFLKQGYADTSVSGIVQTADLTKGALYHHFEDKEGIFRAILEEMHRELVNHLRAAAATGRDPLERVEAMARRYLEHCGTPEFAPLAVIEAPAVLGWKGWCRLVDEHGLRAFSEALREAMEAGLIREEPPKELARILLGTLDTAARVAADASSRQEAREEVWGTVERLLEGLWSEKARQRRMQKEPP